MMSPTCALVMGGSKASCPVAEILSVAVPRLAPATPTLVDGVDPEPGDVVFPPHAASQTTPSAPTKYRRESRIPSSLRCRLHFRDLRSAVTRLRARWRRLDRCDTPNGVTSS